MAKDGSALAKTQAFFKTKTFRFGLSIVMLALVAFLLSREIHPSQIASALREAKMEWVVAAFFVGALSWVGAAVPLKVLADIKIPFTDALLVQVASSFVGVVAPAGLGPVALHLDYLKRRGMDTAAAAAIVTFIELAQFVTSILMLAVALPLDHDFPHMNFPLKKILLVAAVIVIVLIATLANGKVRGFVLGKLKEYWAKVLPELQRIKQHPADIFWSFMGVFVQTGTYALALVLCLKAVGHPISIPLGITIYLIGNTLGSAVPTPGGIGSTLAATVAALHLVGVPTALAVTGTLLFRLVTFYLQVPIGGVAFAYMQRKKLL